MITKTINDQNQGSMSAALMRQGPIVAFNSFGSMPIGFHVESLQVARLTNELWSQMAGQSDSNSTAQAELTAWAKAPSAPAEDWKQAQSITLNVTQVCNLACTYCAAGGDGSYGDPVKKISLEKTIPQLKFLMDRTPVGGDFRITYLGGEPLLYPEGLAIISETAKAYAIEKKISLSQKIVTNGTLFTDSTLALLKRMETEVVVSWDGPAEINDLARKTKSGRGSTLLVEQGLALLFANRESLPRISFSGVFGAFNTQVRLAYETYQKYPVDEMTFDFDHSSSNLEASQQFMAGMAEIAALAFAKGGEEELRKIAVFNGFFNSLDRQKRLENFCGSGKNFWMVDARSQIYTCPWVVNQPKEIVGLGSVIWEHSLKAYAEPLNQKSDCQSCWARNLCGGGCMFIHNQATGSKFKVDEVFCERIRFLIMVALMYYTQVREEIT